VLLSSAQTLHASVMASQPPDAVDGSDGGRVLWRLDQERHDLQLYVVSPVRPDFTGLLESAGWPTSITWDETDYARFLDGLDMGQRWRFRLTANPVRVQPSSTAGGERARGKIVPHVTARHQEEWLIERAPNWGFSIPAESHDHRQLTVAERHTARFDRKNGPGSLGRPRTDRVAITRATFEGVLRVEDADRLRTALTTGMGRAKAYGCGLMTLAPVR
jgi:CRISPR system Cascade subunit CasE